MLTSPWPTHAGWAGDRVPRRQLVDGSRALTTQFYVLPDEPALAAGDGSSGYTFFRYRGAAGTGVGGGLLVLPPGYRRRTDADAVRTAYGLAPDAQIP